MSLDKDRIFEEKLKQVQPAQVSDLLLQRIESAIRKSEAATSRNRTIRYLAWGGLLSAASIMIACGLFLFNRVPQSEAGPLVSESSVTHAAGDTKKDDNGQKFEPVLAQNNLKERVDEGIVFLDTGLTARRYRYEFIDRVVWRNPKNGALVEMEIPREEVVLVPVQTY